MVFPVVGGDGKPTGYEIDNSLRFNANNDRLERTPSSTGSRRKFTCSVWFKYSSGSQSNIMAWITDSNNAGEIRATASGQIQVFEFQGGTQSNGFGFYSTRLLRDPSAWYHLFISVDTTQGTSGLIMYINGQEITYDTRTLGGGTNLDCNFNLSGTPMKIGSDRDNGNVWNGYLSEMHWIDGTIKSHTDFGELDDNGVWIPKAYDGTYGTNGFYLEFKQTGTSANSSGIGADTSGNDNHFTPTNLAAIDVTTDTCTNNFATLNPLDNAVLTLSEGNTKATHSDSGGGEENRATLGAANGKWYFEFQIQHTVGSLNPFAVGMMSNTGRNPLESDLKSTEAFTSAWHSDTSNNRIESRVSGSATNLNCNLSYPDNGDIINVAMDLDNGRVYFGKNGTYINDASGNTGNPSTGANPPVSFTTGGHFYFPAIHNRGSQGLTVSLNTGQPSFSISSGNSDANGYGNFEYAVPSGFYSLCTKNLAEYG